MKLLIVSDSHFKKTNQEIFDFIKPDIAVHAGDSQLQADDIDLKNYQHKVKGNCDFYDFPTYEAFNFGTKKVFLTHGHLFDVDYGSQSLVQIAAEAGCQIAIHGHTHHVRREVIDNVLILNSGSTTLSRCQYPPTFMVVTVQDNSADQFEIELYNAKSFELIERQIINL
ncbi:MAG: YfcE family phosphodiesterase [Mycoplasmatales bacterium]